MKVALDSLGCKLNQAEMEGLAHQLAVAGYELATSPGQADVYILNTCTVTGVADAKSRQLLRRAHRVNPGATVVATGCLAQRSPHEVANLEGVSLVVGNRHKVHLVDLLEETGHLGRPHAKRGLVQPNGPGLRTRAFVKVQDGCTNFCSYCVVPSVRGGEKSIPVAQVLAQVRQRLDEGYQEIVLTGVKVGAYSSDGLDLTGLLQRMLSETEATRLRLSSLQPQDITPELVGLWQDSKLCRHFHLSLQSGSDSVLERMRRRYSAADYQRAVSLIRERVPEAAITTDVIAGFPGETDAEFDESYDFCRGLGFARVHVFSYSPRPGTEAAGLPGQVEAQVKRERSRRLLALAEDSAGRFREQFQGRTMPVLWENQVDGRWSGLTDNYIRVYTESDRDLANQLTTLKLA